MPLREERSRGTPVDPLDIIAGTASAAFATDESGRIVVWNKAAERLLGHGAARILGKPCHEVVCGKDVFGNRFCDQECSLLRMVRKREAIHHFGMELRTASGRTLRADVSVVVIPGPRSSQFTIIHLLHPVVPIPETAEFPGVSVTSAHADAAPVSPEAAPQPPGRSGPLTEREVEVLRLMADGAGTEGIAVSLFISHITVRNHIQNILRKLDVHNRLEAVSLALRTRLI
jgi:PAS domain S-box-containing protein